MVINVLDENFNKFHETDDYISLMWCIRYFDIGAVDLELPASTENLQIFKRGYYITRDDDEHIYRITNIELKTEEDSVNTLIIGATDCLGILNQRVNNNVSYEENGNVINTFKGTCEKYIRELIEDNFIMSSIPDRNVDILKLGDLKGFKETIEFSRDFFVVGEEIITVCKAYNYGCKITWKDSKLVFDLYKGVDRSDKQADVSPVVFSPEYDNLISSKYTVDSKDIKNAIIPYVSGKDTSDKYSDVWTTLSDSLIGFNSGLDRYELKVDIKDAIITSSNGAIIGTNSDLLDTVIKKSLSTNIKSKVNFEGEILSYPYVYKKDWNLGDVVTIKNEFGVKANARIIEVIETWNEEGYIIEPVFKFEDIEEIDFAVLTEDGKYIVTEYGEVLIYE